MPTKEPTFHAPQSLHPLGSPCSHTHSHTHTHTEWMCHVLARRNTLFFFPPLPCLLSLTSRACPQFRGYLKNQRQTKTLPPPAPPPIQRGKSGGGKESKKKKKKKKGEAARLNCRPRQGFLREGKWGGEKWRRRRRKGGEWKWSGSHRDLLPKT